MGNLRTKIRSCVTTTALVLSVVGLLSISSAQPAVGMGSERELICRTVTVYNRTFDNAAFMLGIGEKIVCNADLAGGEELSCEIKVGQIYLFLWMSKKAAFPGQARVMLEKEQYDKCVAGDDTNIPFLIIKSRGRRGL